LYSPGTTFASRAQAEAAIFRHYGWCNPRRIQAGLGGLSTYEYEAAHHSRHQHEPAPMIIQPQPVHPR
jgi:putative transposase